MMETQKPQTMPGLKKKNTIARDCVTKFRKNKDFKEISVNFKTTLQAAYIIITKIGEENRQEIATKG